MASRGVLERHELQALFVIAGLNSPLPSWNVPDLRDARRGCRHRPRSESRRRRGTSRGRSRLRTRWLTALEDRIPKRFGRVVGMPGLVLEIFPRIQRFEGERRFVDL